MNANEVAEELKAKYPKANIVIHDDDGFLEVVAEVEPTSEHPEYSRAVVVAGKSKPHYHKKSLEKYRLISGKLTIAIDGKTRELKVDEEVEISPGLVHSVAGDNARFEVVSTPGWSADDHFLEI